jgi:hypothetical protein
LPHHLSGIAPPPFDRMEAPYGLGLNIHQLAGLPFSVLPRFNATKAVQEY